MSKSTSNLFFLLGQQSSFFHLICMEVNNRTLETWVYRSHMAGSPFAADDAAWKFSKRSAGLAQAAAPVSCLLCRRHEARCVRNRIGHKRVCPRAEGARQAAISHGALEARVRRTSRQFRRVQGGWLTARDMKKMFVVLTKRFMGEAADFARPR